MKKHNIEIRIGKVTGCKRKEGESDKDFLPRAARACDLPDDKWEELGDPAQAWANEAMQAVGSGAEPPAFGAPRTVVEEEEVPPPAAESEPVEEVESEDAVEEEQAETTSEEEADNESPAPVASKPTKAKSVKKEKPVKTKKTKVAKEEHGPSAHAALRAIIIDNPNASRAELSAMARKAGVTLADPSVGAAIAAVDMTLRLLAERGCKVPVPNRRRPRADAAPKKAAASKPVAKKTKRSK